MLGQGCKSNGGMTALSNTGDDFTNNGAVVGTATTLGNGGYRGYTFRAAESASGSVVLRLD